MASPHIQEALASSKAKTDNLKPITIQRSEYSMAKLDYHILEYYNPDSRISFNECEESLGGKTLWRIHSEAKEVTSHDPT